jgi:uncharacterized protein (DUF58 family)
VRDLWRKLRETFSGRIRYKITRVGLFFAGSIVLVGAAAVLTGNNLLYLIVAAMMATLLVSGLVSRLCLAALELDFLVPEHVPARRSVPGKLYVRNQKWIMPSFSIHVEGIRAAGGPTLESAVYFPIIAGGVTLDQTVQIQFPRRGPYRKNSFAFSTSFPFGFLAKSALVELLREVIVYPCIDPQPGFENLVAGIAGEMESNYRGMGRDFYRIRPYEAFESARHVDWKASAHAANLMVREFTREQERVLEVYLDRDLSHDLDQWFEHAVDCCAFAVWRLATQGASIHFRSNGILLRHPEDGDVYSILRYLALVYPQRAGDPEPPIGATSYKLVFTASPRKFEEAGWAGAQILTPRSLPRTSASVQTEAAAAASPAS